MNQQLERNYCNGIICRKWKNNDEFEYKMYKVVNNFICTFHLIIPGFRLSSGCKHRKKLAHWPLLSHGKRDVIRASNSLIVHYQMHVHYEQGSSQVKPFVFTLVWNVRIIIHGFWIRQEMDLIFRQTTKLIRDQLFITI